MDGPPSYDLVFRPTPDARARPGRLFLADDYFLLASTRHSRLVRLAGDATNGLFGSLPESLGLYNPHAVTWNEALHDPDARRVYYADIDALAPFVRPTGFSLYVRVGGRSEATDEIRLRFRSSEERRETVELAGELRRRAREAGTEVSVFDPGGRTRLLPLGEEN